MKKPYLIWLALIGLAFFYYFSQQESLRPQLQLQGRTMGTTYNIKLTLQDGQQLDSDGLKAEIDSLLARVNKTMSTYDPQSELSRFNQSRSPQAVAISKQLAYVIDEAIRLAEISDGALDVTVGPLVNLWGFGPEGRPNKVPDAATIARVQEKIGIEHLLLSAQGLQKTLPELYVDLSTIAKGYGVDVVAEHLIAQGIANFMVEIGGELRVKGLNAHGKPWRIAVEKPVTGERAMQRIITPKENGVATSGDYRNYFEQDGVRYSHIIDPDTARPINHKLASVTVLHPSSMTADGLSTMLMVLGPERGMALAETLQLPALMLIKTEHGFEERLTEAMRPYLLEPTP